MHSGSDKYKSNDLSHRGRVKLPVNLEVLSADGGPVADGVQEVRWKVPNWIRLLLTGLDDGSGRYDEAPDPASIQIPVRIDPKNGEIVDVDTDLIETELEQWRELAKDDWKRTESATRSVHQLGDLKDFAREGIPGIANEMRQAVAGMREDMRSASSGEVSAAQIESRFAEADRMGAVLAPATIDAMRKSIVPMLQQQVQLVRDGLQSGAMFDLDLECHVRSGVLSQTEMADLREQAGTPGLG